jgi:hypothetical protein
MEIRGETITLGQLEINSFSWKKEICLLLPTDENYNDNVQIQTYLGDVLYCCNSHTLPTFMLTLTRCSLKATGHVSQVLKFFFSCGAATQRGSWPPHS